MKDVLLEVGKLEHEFNDKISRATLTVDVVEEKYRLLQEDIDRERKLRADETYRREIVDRETASLVDQIRTLEGKCVAYNAEVIKLKANNNQLKDWAHSATALKDNALSQAREHSSQVDRLEKDNSMVRQRLYQLEVDFAKLKMKKDMLKERLAQVPDLRMGTAGHPGGEICWWG